MATLASNAPELDSRTAWFWRFLKEELAPYPGRLALVARMLLAATMVMIMTMTFRIPYGPYGAAYAITISRESPSITVSAVKTIVAAFGAGIVYVLIGAIFFVNEPLIRFLWVIATFFIMFYGLSAMSNYVAAVRFSYLLIITTPLWDQHLTADARVTGTLWAVGTMGAASIITVLLELAFARRSPDPVVRSIVERLSAVEAVLADYAANGQVSESSMKNIRRLEMVGTSRLRRMLQRCARAPQHREQIGAVVALAGRLVDLASTLEYVGAPVDDRERDQVRDLARNISGIRAALL